MPRFTSEVFMFQIVVDSGANIPAELVKHYDIKVLSFVNIADGKPLVCFDPDLTIEQERIKGKEYYDSIRAGMKVQTGLIGCGEFEECFRSLTANGDDVLCLTISSGISGTFNAARIAANAVNGDADDDAEACGTDAVKRPRVRLIDSKNASLATGILAIYASEMRTQGMDIDEVVPKIEDMVPRINGVFTVDDLRYLARTGRLTGSKALIGNLLSIKPILRGNRDGFIVQYKKCHGRKAALNSLVSLVCDNVVNPEEQILGIAHADAYEESLYIMNEITKRIKVRGFINTTYDFCTGSHVGPETIALFFLGKDRELNGEGLLSRASQAVAAQLEALRGDGYIKPVPHGGSFRA